MTVYACPVCSSPLQKQDRVFRCQNRHSFDLAKEGYVNLLPANKKRSLTPGDNAAMVAARRRFLGAGHYQPLAAALVQLVEQPQRLVDLGCGEGYFTAALVEAATEVYGVDISKLAIKAACKQSSANFVVASTMQLPFLDQSFDAATVIMAPTSGDIPRVLQPGALLCRVSPGENHLIELRQLAYRDVRPVKQPQMTLPGFTPTGDKRVTFETLVENQGLVDIVAMTPMQFRTSKEFQTQIAQLDE